MDVFVVVLVVFCLLIFWNGEEKTKTSVGKRESFSCKSKICKLARCCYNNLTFSQECRKGGHAPTPHKKYRGFQFPIKLATQKYCNTLLVAKETSVKVSSFFSPPSNSLRDFFKISRHHCFPVTNQTNTNI